MTKETTQKILQKARAGGWNPTRADFEDVPDPDFSHRNRVYPWRYLPFMPGFAEAFWGEKDWGILEYNDKGGNLMDCLSFTPAVPQWKTHLQLIVLEPDPFTYLAKFI